MKFTYILFLSLFVLKLVHSEVYLNPFIYPQSLKFDENESITYTLKEYHKDGSVKILTGEQDWGSDLNDIFGYGFGSSSLNSEVGETENITRFKFNFGTNTRDLMEEIDSYLVFQNRPTSKHVTIGATWNEIYNAHGSYEHNNTVWVTFKEETNASFEIAGISPVQTPWGITNAIKVVSIFDTFIQLNPSDSDSRFNRYAFVAKSNTSELLYVQGLGLYSYNRVFSTPQRRDNSSISTRNEALARDTYSDLWSAPPISTIESKFLENSKVVRKEGLFKTTSIKLNIQGYNPLNAEQHSTNPQLDSWTWNGAFPWVYNSASDSWFYYAFSGNSYNAYDARSGSWLTFDSGTGAWNPSN
jgi:hypothetical protein